MPDGQAGGAAAETAVGQEGAFLAQVHRFQIGGRVQHFLHAGTAARAFVRDHNDVAALHFTAQDAVTGRFLGVEDLRRAGELPDGSVHTGRLHDAAVGRNVSPEHRQTAVLRVGVGDGTDATVLAVGVQFLVISLLGAQFRREPPGGGAAVQLQGLLRHVLRQNGEAVHRLRKGGAIHPVKGGVDETRDGQFAEDGEDAAGAVHVLNMVFCSIGGHLADAGDLPGKGVNVRHREIHAGFPRHGQQMQDRVRGSAHRNVQRHGVQERRAGRDAARQDAFIPVPVVFPGIVDDEPRGLAEEFLPVLVRREDRSVARQGQADGLGQAVHRVRREHAGAATAARAGRGFDLCHLGIRQGGVGRLDHRIDQVQLAVAQHAGLHRAARDEDRRDVQPHRGHQHPGCDLVAVADADHRVSLVGVDHVFDAVRDDFAGRKGIQHAVMAHGDAVIDGDGVEFGRIASQPLDLGLDQLAGLMQVRMAGDELRKGIHHRDHRFSHLFRFHARCSPEGAGACHPASLEGDAASERMFHTLLKNTPSSADWKGLMLSLYRHAFPVRVYLTRIIRTRARTSTMFIPVSNCYREQRWKISF